MAYTYNVNNLGGYNPDQMRFELGDNLATGQSGENFFVLQDEEITRCIETARSWKEAKLKCLEAILFRFAYDTDTKAGPLAYSFASRNALWESLYRQLKGELALGRGFPLTKIPEKGPYFYHGLHNNPPEKEETP